ncbi:MAG TPA: cobaltochelatase subunit CobN [Pirellulales bacterium]|nr:cobaltochelatase subunit CobN [Pirellulales bacterium]
MLNRLGSNLRGLVFAVLAIACCGAARAPAAEEPPAEIGFLGVWDRAMPLVENAARAAKVRVAFYKPDDLLASPAIAERLRLLFVLNLSPESVGPLVKHLSAAKARNGELKIVPLDARSSHAELDQAGLLTRDDAVPKYWRPNGPTNVKRLLVYATAKYLSRPGEIEPPVVVPDFGCYDYESEQPFDTVEACRKFKAGHDRWREGAPVAVLLTQQSFWITHDLAVIDAQVLALERRGVNVLVIFGDTQERVARLLEDARPDLVIEDRHGAMWSNRELLEKLDVPYVRPISMLGSTIDEWRQNPQGMSYRDVGMFLSLQEYWGVIEPVVVGGLKANYQGFRLHEPIADRIERSSERIARWLWLRKKPNQEKRLAIVYYNQGLGQDDLLRGSPTGAFLDGPASLAAFLPRLAAQGFRVEPMPSGPAELVDWARQRGRNIGPWAQGELETLADRGSPALVPLRKYEAWFREKLSEANQRKAMELYGPPPGKLMVVERNGEPQIVLPRMELGNIILAPQPERGEKQDEALLHSRDVPPPHNYLAFYWWLEEEFKADAIVHWGTHGNLEMLPGKETGLSADCWCDVCAGDIPIVNLWIMDNLGEATTSRRRSHAALVDHMPPALVNAGLSGDLQTLHDDIYKFRSLEPGLLKEEFRKQIAAAVGRAGIADTLDFDAGEGRLPDEAVAKVDDYLHEVHHALTPTSLHVLGRAPPERLLAPYLVSMLRGKFLEHLVQALPVPAEAAASRGHRQEWLRARGEELLRVAVLEGRDPPFPLSPELERDLAFAREMHGKLLAADEEIAGLLHALEGGYIRPGPGPDPIRNPSCLPGGRNLYTLNPEEIPTRAAWEVAVKLVDEMFAHAPPAERPKKIGFDLNGMETMRDFGVLEAQVLYLLGVRPVWDANNLAVDIELIPAAELKRPRIDVFLAMGGLYKDNFPTRVQLLDKAVRLVSSLDEPENYVRKGTRRLAERLAAHGFAANRVEQFATARIFGTKPGNMSGTNILDLVPRSGVWDSSDEIADVYIDHMSYVYTEGAWGEKIDGLYESSIQDVDTLVRVWASNMTSQLSNHHAYEYFGGLSMAVKKLTAREPRALIADVRDPERARVRNFEEVLATNLRSELLNRKWIEGMREHGYAGAGHMAELVKNAFGWSVTRPESVSDRDWNEIYEVYVQDRRQLGLREWFESEGPHALEEILATMLEAHRKGYWQATTEQLTHLSQTYATLVARHGDSGGLVSGGNKRLHEHVAKLLAAPGPDGGEAPGETLAMEMSASLARSAGAPKTAAEAGEASETEVAREHVVGKRLEPAEEPVQEPAQETEKREVAAPPVEAEATMPLSTTIFGMATLGLIGLGVLLRQGAA